MFFKDEFFSTIRRRRSDFDFSSKENYVRLLSKEKNSDNKPFTEKSQRPISELNILPKYGPIKIFMDQFRNQMLLKLKNNQFAFPG